MQCYNTSKLDNYLVGCDRIVEEERYLDFLAREKAEKILQTELPNDDYDSVIEFIYDNEHFINEFDKCLMNLITSGSVEALENMQKFMFEMAYETSRNLIKAERRKNEA